VVLTTPQLKKNNFVAKYYKGLLTWTDSFDKRPTLRKMDTRSGTWNVRWGRMDWIDLAHDRDQWRGLENLQIPQNVSSCS
jgi:hypothetical protein